ncbi:MAG: hypothetical protein ACTSQ8_13705 [Candidatus Helarchaeota archaeon]
MAQNMKEKSEVQLAKKLFSNIDEYRIATHKRLDADAAFSTALILSLQTNPQPVLFVDSTDTDIHDNVILLDLELGENSIKGDGVGSCFGLLVEVMNKLDPVFCNYLRTIANHLNRTDTGKNDFHSYLDPHYLIRWWRLAGLGDEEILHTIYLLFKGMQKSVEKEGEAQIYLKTYGRKEKFCMIVENPPKDAKIHKFVFRNGTDAYIYFNTRPEEMGMGIIINPKLQQEGFSCKYLKNKLPEEWIILEHMAFWGSLKIPKNPAQSGISLENFVRIVNKQIKSFKKKRHKRQYKERKENLKPKNLNKEWTSGRKVGGGIDTTFRDIVRRGIHSSKEAGSTIGKTKITLKEVSI